MADKKVSRRSFIKKSSMGIAASAILPAILSSTEVAAEKSKKAHKMFCYQCEQTMGGKGCTKVGMCGKTAEVATLQDLLIHTLKGLALSAQAGRKVGIDDNEVNRFTCMALFSTLTNVDFDPYRFDDLIHESVDFRDTLIVKVKAASGKIDLSHDSMTIKPRQSIEGLVQQGKQYGLMSDPDADPDIRSLQHMLLYGLKGVGAYTDHAGDLGEEDPKNYEFVHRGLAALTDDSLGMDALLGLVLECGQWNLRAMELLDAGNTKFYGHPVPTAVPLGVKKGKAILVSGHDMMDLAMVLKASAGKGIYVYTHGEMLPGHGYPGLKQKYPHLYGNFGSAWHSQKREFDTFPGSILMTSNCLQKPVRSYKKNIFTTGSVGWPGVAHLSNKNLDPLIQKALELPGFSEDVEDQKILVGFGRKAVIDIADKIVAGVKEGAIKHFFLVGGCDGVKKSRNYYTKFVEQVPKESIVMTLACGKFKFYRHELGEIAGIPRLLDVGQCNDTYSAIQIALALAKAFDTDVNGLPLSFIISWYEQKAVAILYTLLALGIRDIHLGPTLPAFVTPNILNVLVKNYNLKPISTPENDLKMILG
ncbi:MAG: hydroxylamine reductase [Desulfobacterium sp.]